jgi:hypothetical protein
MIPEIVITARSVVAIQMRHKLRQQSSLTMKRTVNLALLKRTAESTCGSEKSNVTISSTDSEDWTSCRTAPYLTFVANPTPGGRPSNSAHVAQEDKQPCEMDENENTKKESMTVSEQAEKLRPFDSEKAQGLRPCLTPSSRPTVPGTPTEIFSLPSKDVDDGAPTSGMEEGCVLARR